MLFTGELLRQAERHLSEGLHPRVVTEGFELAKEHALKVLDEFRTVKAGVEGDRELLESVARTSLRTKLREEVADNVSRRVRRWGRRGIASGQRLDGVCLISRALIQ